MKREMNKVIHIKTSIQTLARRIQSIFYCANTVNEDGSVAPELPASEFRSSSATKIQAAGKVILIQNEMPIESSIADCSLQFKLHNAQTAQVFIVPPGCSCMLHPAGTQDGSSQPVSIWMVSEGVPYCILGLQ